jgi:DNA-binding response OmpR family regulator
VRRATENSRDSHLVLIVDDDPQTRQALRRSLIDDGFRVAEASTGREGIAQVVAHGPALVILDLQMPFTNGWWFLRRLQQFPSPRPHVIGLARLGDQERLKAQALGAQEFLDRPCDPEEMVRRVKSRIG